MLFRLQNRGPSVSVPCRISHYLEHDHIPSMVVVSMFNEALTPTAEAIIGHSTGVVVLQRMNTRGNETQKEAFEIVIFSNVLRRCLLFHSSFCAGKLCPFSRILIHSEAQLRAIPLHCSSLKLYLV